MVGLVTAKTIVWGAAQEILVALGDKRAWLRITASQKIRIHPDEARGGLVWECVFRTKGSDCHNLWWGVSGNETSKGLDAYRATNKL